MTADPVPTADPVTTQAPVLFGTRTPVPLPAPGLRFMHEDDAKLLSTAAGLARQLVAHGLRLDDSVLDIGSGYGRLAIGLMSETAFRGNYLGVDILKTQVKWCSIRLTPVNSRYRFKHLDVRNDRYNPGGTLSASEVRLPTRDASIDCCALFSVFTHLYRADIERYLSEIHRVLRPGKVAVTTWLLFDDARLPIVMAPRSMYPMIHAIDEVTRYSDATDPLRAISYHETFVRSLVAAAGLEVVTVERGRWAGGPGADFQDLMVLRRPATRTDQARELARRTRRALGHARRAVKLHA